MNMNINELEFFKMDLVKIRDWAEGISGEWNGDESGIQEDRASVAEEIMITVNQLQELITEMETY